MEKTTAVDVAQGLQEALEVMGCSPDLKSLEKFIVKCKNLSDNYRESAEADALEVDALSKEQFEDATLQAIATQYGLTMNQVVCYMDMCHKMNTETLDGSGLTVVPFWFHQQYVELKQKNEALINESNSLQETIKAVGEKTLSKEAHADLLPERQSIITGNVQPYVPGATGPRVGDEHLDTDNLYVDPREADSRWAR